jgi:uncharacterized membrane protein YbhN (UPF0104 family)/8-oxo-dGTP pyrophosphatase MutT (NUDIX family)
MNVSVAARPKTWLTAPAMRIGLKIGITLALLGLLAAKTDLQAVAERIDSIGLAAAFTCVLVILLLSLLGALRWRIILKRLNTPIAFMESGRLVLIGQFFNQILPSGMGGDAVRVWLLTRAGTRLRTAFLSVAADRIFALAAVVLCMVGSIPLLVPGPAALPVIFLSAAGAGGILLLLSLDQLFRWLPRALPRRAFQAVDVLRELAGVLRLVLRGTPGNAAVLGISVANQLILGWIIWFIARCLHAQISLLTTMALFPPALLLSMMPVSLGGWGVREAALVWLLGTAGVPRDTALAISLLFGLVTTAAGLPGGVLWLLERRISGLPPREMPVLAPATPAVLDRQLTVLSPWVSIMARTVDFGGRVEIYHAVEQADYIAILAVTPDFRIPIVRQYRPALERYTWELPAGMVDAGEAPEATCARELREETGLIARHIHRLGSHAADSARMGNRIHSFLVETEDAEGISVPEAGIELAFVTLDRLRSIILSGEFDLQYHVAAVGLALMRPELAGLLSNQRT